jgi:hypothetical protein
MGIFFKLYHGARISYIWWHDDDVRFVLDQHAELELYIVIAHW